MAALTLLSFSVWPRTPLAWTLVLGVGPVIFLVLSAVEEIGGKYLSALPGVRHADESVERRTAHESLSATRVGYYLVRALILLVPIVMITLWVEDESPRLIPELIRTWWNQNFY